MIETHFETTEAEKSLGELIKLVVPDSHDECSREAESSPSPDCVEIASMDSFPCSDPPGYYAIRL
jgi:hypothetical protein